ncbi:hypothetical protein V2J09_019370 [Rumex salicifolius]
MENLGSIDTVLDFLQRNGFSSAEAALRSELGSRPAINDSQKHSLENKDDKQLEPANFGKWSVKDRELSFKKHGEASDELIVKEIECGTTRNLSESKWQTTVGVDQHGSVELFGNDENFTFSKGSEEPGIDLRSWEIEPIVGSVDPCQRGSKFLKPEYLELQKPGKRQYDTATVADEDKIDSRPVQEMIEMDNQKKSWVGSTSKANEGPISERNAINDIKAVNRPTNVATPYSEDLLYDPWTRNDTNSGSYSGQLKECSVKTVFPLSGMHMAAFDGFIGSGVKQDGKRKTEATDIRAAVKEQVDEVGRSLYLRQLQDIYSQTNPSNLALTLASVDPGEELPRLPHVRLKSEDKLISANWEDKFDPHGQNLSLDIGDSNYLIGTFLDIPVGQEINSSGGKKTAGGSWLSISQGIAEDTSDLVSGFATIGDGLSESIDYPNEYWDSDEYEDDDDVGYMRQPIENEAWFLAHEIDYPSDNEKGTAHRSGSDPQERPPDKVEDDNQSIPDEGSYFSGEQYLLSTNVQPVSASDDPVKLSVTELYGRTNGDDFSIQYDGQLMGEDEVSLMPHEPVWKGFVTQSNDLIKLRDGEVMNNCRGSTLDDLRMNDDRHVRSIGVGINSDDVDVGGIAQRTLVGGTSKDLESDLDGVILRSRHLQSDASQKNHDNSVKSNKINKHSSDKYIMENVKSEYVQAKNHTEDGFLFPPSIRGTQVVEVGSGKSLWSTNTNPEVGDETDCYNRHRSSFSPARSSSDENDAAIIRSAESSPSNPSDYGHVDSEHAKEEEGENAASLREEDPGAALEEEEAAAVQEQVRQIQVQEEEFETFNLKIVHRKNRTGFEEDKNFHVILNSVIAGRYHVTEYLGSAAFSKAIQAHDLHTGMDVCVKIIKNNKDFFDQSLDEIKLLKYINKHDPADRYHILRLFDYFYYREHLLIVCELLKANLYEFHKFNRESGGEVYFTMPRLQKITIQVLEALNFLHGLGLIHCDLKPENILVKSYSRCEVKVIDLGSSCFETDHLCSYVQSRSYRAPEVILGLPYDKKIDIWSLGCILAELCTGNVLFQNDSAATLLARVIGIISPIDQEMLAKGRDTYKCFTKNHMLYERNQETNRLEYLIPKKTSLRHRLHMGDRGFIEFVSFLLDIDPMKRPSASEALKHPWLSYPYEPISAYTCHLPAMIYVKGFSSSTKLIRHAIEIKGATLDSSSSGENLSSAL